MLTQGYGFELGALGQKLEYFYITWNGNNLHDHEIAMHMRTTIQKFDEICSMCNGYLEHNGANWKFINKEDMERAMMVLKLMR